MYITQRARKVTDEEARQNVLWSEKNEQEAFEPSMWGQYHVPEANFKSTLLKCEDKDETRLLYYSMI